MNKDTIEIRFADLAAMVLKAFKPMVCAALIVALLGGAFGVFRSYRAGKNIAAFEESLSKAEARLSESGAKLAEAEELLAARKEAEIPQAEDLICRAEELVNSRTEYMENSLYQAIDPFHCGFARLSVYLKPLRGGGDPASVLSSAVSRLFSDESELFLSLQEIMSLQTDPAYIKELVSVSVIAGDMAEIKVLHADPQIAEQAADAICAELFRFLGGDARFSPEIADRYCGFEVNWEMRDRQLLNKGNLISADQSLSNAKEQLQRLKKDIPDLEKDVEKANTAFLTDQNASRKAQKQYDSALLTTKNIVKRAAVYFLIALCVSLLIGCFFVVLLGIAGGKIQNRNTVLSFCRYPLLGILPCEKPRLFENAIRKLEGESCVDRSSALNSIVQTLYSLVGKRSACFVSSCGKETAGILLPWMDGRIPACGDIVNDPEAVKQLSTFDSIILIEKKGSSEISMVESEIQRAASLGKDILGIILT